MLCYLSILNIRQATGSRLHISSSYDRNPSDKNAGELSPGLLVWESVLADLAKLKIANRSPSRDELSNTARYVTRSLLEGGGSICNGQSMWLPSAICNLMR